MPELRIIWMACRPLMDSSAPPPTRGCTYVHTISTACSRPTPCPPPPPPPPPSPPGSLVQPQVLARLAVLAAAPAVLLRQQGGQGRQASVAHRRRWHLCGQTRLQLSAGLLACTKSWLCWHTAIVTCIAFPDSPHIQPPNDNTRQDASASAASSGGAAGCWPPPLWTACAGSSPAWTAPQCRTRSGARTACSGVVLAQRNKGA